MSLNRDTMKIQFLIIICICSLSACATAPMSPEEFKQERIKSSNSEVTILSSISYDLAIQRIKNYADKCLSFKVTNVSSIELTKNGNDLYHFLPKLSKNEEILTLTLQYKNTSGGSLTKMPEDGMYVLVTELSKSGLGTKVQSYFYDQMGLRFRTAYTRQLEWLRDEKHLCPDIKVGI